MNNGFKILTKLCDYYCLWLGIKTNLAAESLRFLLRIIQVLGLHLGAMTGYTK
jgi:hypothetical protein